MGQATAGTQASVYQVSASLELLGIPIRAWRLITLVLKHTECKRCLRQKLSHLFGCFFSKSFHFEFSFAIRRLSIGECGMPGRRHYIVDLEELCSQLMADIFMFVLRRGVLDGFGRNFTTVWVVNRRPMLCLLQNSHRPHSRNRICHYLLFVEPKSFINFTPWKLQTSSNFLPGGLSRKGWWPLRIFSVTPSLSALLNFFVNASEEMGNRTYWCSAVAFQAWSPPSDLLHTQIPPPRAVGAGASAHRDFWMFSPVLGFLWADLRIWKSGSWPKVLSRWAQVGRINAGEMRGSWYWKRTNVPIFNRICWSRYNGQDFSFWKALLDCVLRMEDAFCHLDLSGLDQVDYEAPFLFQLFQDGFALGRSVNLWDSTRST